MLFPLPQKPPQHQHLVHPPWLPPLQPPGPLHPSTEHRCRGDLAKRSMGDISGGHQHGQLSSSRNSAVQPHPQVRQSYVPCFGQYHIQVEAFNCRCPAPWPVLDLSDCGSTRTVTPPKASPNPSWKETRLGGDEARPGTRENYLAGSGSQPGPLCPQGTFRNLKTSLCHN